MNLCWVTIKVNNLEESLKFYNEVIGLNISERFNTPDGTEFAMLGKKNEAKIELIYNPNHTNVKTSEDITIGFFVDSQEIALNIMEKNNIEVIKGPISPNQDVSFFFVKDPNGYEIQLVDKK